MPVETRSPDKPKPINTGPSQAEGIAKFACRVKHADLIAERRLRLKISILDSFACAIDALGAPPVEACLAQAKEFVESSKCIFLSYWSQFGASLTDKD
jgi:2-methylcitrate dehydratase PrpD